VTYPSGAFFDFVNNRLATGGQINAPSDVQALVNAGINVIIDANDDFNDGQLLSGVPGMHYLWNPTPDDGKPKPVSYWQTTLSFAMPLLSQPGYKVYNHCRMGINRGPCNTLAILMASGFTEAQAVGMIQAVRPQAQMFYRDNVAAAVAALGYC
jgi:protein-tyrosine phosphatase